MAKRYEGLARLATISATVFGVSLGLCGATFVATITFGNLMIDGYGGGAYRPLGILELLGMAAGLLGLAIAGISALVQWIGSHGAKDEEGE
jgi:hypothetical protein